MAGACGIIRWPGLFFQLDGSGYPGDVADNPGGVSVARKVLCQVDVSVPGSSTSQHNRSIELTLAEVIVQADSITTYSRVVTILSQEKLGRHFPAGKKPGATHTIRA